MPSVDQRDGVYLFGICWRADPPLRCVGVQVCNLDGRLKNPDQNLTEARAFFQITFILEACAMKTLWVLCNAVHNPSSHNLTLHFSFQLWYDPGHCKILQWCCTLVRITYWCARAAPLCGLVCRLQSFFYEVQLIFSLLPTPPLNLLYFCVYIDIRTWASQSWTLSCCPLQS